jgi:hypothetical protein
MTKRAIWCSVRSKIVNPEKKNLPTSKSVPRCRYARVRGGSMMCKNVAANIGPTSTGPSPRACKRNRMPPDRATRSMSMRTSIFDQLQGNFKKQSRTRFSKSLYTNGSKRIFRMLGNCYKCSHNGFRKRNGLCFCNAASISGFRSDVDDSTNELNDLFPLYSMFVISC